LTSPARKTAGKWQVSIGGGWESHWSQDGKTLFYAGSGTIVSVSIDGRRSFAMGQPHVVLQGFVWVPVESSETFDIAPDSRHILITRVKEGFDAPNGINVVQNWYEDLRKK
jgi:hypothetical protein